jgi:hypothetical protein
MSNKNIRKQILTELLKIQTKTTKDYFFDLDQHDLKRDILSARWYESLKRETEIFNELNSIDGGK